MKRAVISMKPILTSMIQNQVWNKGWKWRKMKDNFQLLLSHFRLIIDSGHRLGWPFNYFPRSCIAKLGDVTVKRLSSKVRVVPVCFGLESPGNFYRRSKIEFERFWSHRSTIDVRNNRSGSRRLRSDERFLNSFVRIWNSSINNYICMSAFWYE